MERIIKHYQTILAAEQFVVTGSLAMSYMGLVKKEEVGDIDIILVNPPSATIELLKRLVEASPARTSPPDYKKEELFIFMQESVKIDVFIQNKPIETKLMVDDFMISPVGRIIEAKRECNRPKDWIQLMKIAKKFFNQKDFNHYVENFK